MQNKMSHGMGPPPYIGHAPPGHIGTSGYEAALDPASASQYEIKAQITEPLLAQICMFNLISEQRLNARFFI